MQREITKPAMLLDKNGKIIQKGYATTPILRYCRKYVKKKHRLKEWDYYLIYNKDYAVSLTAGKCMSLFMIWVAIIDLKEHKTINKSIIRITPKKFQLPQNSRKGNIVYKDKFTRLSIIVEGSIRMLLLKKLNYKMAPDIDISLVLYNEPKDSLVFYAPFSGDKSNFCYSRKIIGMRAAGYVRYQGKHFGFSPIDSFAVIDWSRGVWPYKTVRYWGAAAGKIHGKVFGFNLGYGSCDASYATENMLFYDGTASKPDCVTFHIPKNSKNKYDYLKPWTITSSDNRVELVFVPIMDHSLILPVSLLPLSVNRHQVFGKFTGRAILDDGTVIYIKELMGFAERSEYRW